MKQQRTNLPNVSLPLKWTHVEFTTTLTRVKSLISNSPSFPSNISSFSLMRQKYLLSPHTTSCEALIPQAKYTQLAYTETKRDYSMSLNYNEKGKSNKKNSFTKKGRERKTNYNSMTSASQNTDQAERNQGTRIYTRPAYTDSTVRRPQEVSKLLNDNHWTSSHLLHVVPWQGTQAVVDPSVWQKQDSIIAILQVFSCTVVAMCSRGELQFGHRNISLPSKNTATP